MKRLVNETFKNNPFQVWCHIGEEVAPQEEGLCDMRGERCTGE